jgi:hypothetical protein
LASEAYEIPDNDSLTARMLGISLEHGLLQGVDSGTAEFMLAGLEHYLKDVVQQIFERVNRLGEKVMTAEDIASIAYSSPNLFVEHTSALYRLQGTMLQDDEDDEPVEVETQQPTDLDLLLKEILGS